MNQERWTAVDHYIEGLLVRHDEALDGAIQSSAAAGLPSIQVSPTQGKLLMLLALMCKARNILEIGTLGGYSAIWLARALPKDGRLITLEFEPKHAEIARANFKRAGVADRIDVRLGPALDTLPKLEAEKRGPFDLIFIDADKEGYPDYLTWSLRLSQPGTVIVADNIVRKGAVVDAKSTDKEVQGVRKFNEMLAAEPRISATVVQTVGSKGYDGLAIAVVVNSER